MKKRSLLWPSVSLAGLLAMLAPEVAMAAIDSMGAAADHITGLSSNGDGQMQALVIVFSGLMYLAGCIFGVKGIMQLRDHTEIPQQVRLTKPLTSMTVSTALLALPGFVGMFADTVAAIGMSSGLSDSWSGTGSISQGDSLDKVAEALAMSVPSLNHLIKMGAAIAGLFLIVRAVFMLPQLEQGRVEGGKIMWTLLSGVALWSLLPFVSTVMGSVGMQNIESTILTAVYAQGNNDSFDKTINSVLTFVSMIGLIAFIRGTLILKAIGENKDGTMGRALTHIIGGAAAMNIKWTVAMLATTIGSKSAICGIASAGVLCGF